MVPVMKPSRIVKRAWKQAGKPCSLKTFARHIQQRNHGTYGLLSERHFASVWLKNKKASN